MKYAVIGAIVLGCLFWAWKGTSPLGSTSSPGGASGGSPVEPRNSFDGTNNDSPPKDHGEIQSEAKKHWDLGTDSLDSFVESLAPDPDRLVALNALRDQFSQDPAYFSALIETLPREGSRNSMKGFLLNQLAFDKSRKDAIDFVFENTGVGRKRSRELYPLYLSWFKRDAEGAIQDAKRLELKEDLAVFANVLDSEKSKVDGNTFETAEEAGLAHALLKKIAELVLIQLENNEDQEKLLEYYPKIREFLGE